MHFPSSLSIYQNLDAFQVSWRKQSGLISLGFSGIQCALEEVRLTSGDSSSSSVYHQGQLPHPKTGWFIHCSRTCLALLELLQKPTASGPYFSFVKGSSRSPVPNHFLSFYKRINVGYCPRQPLSWVSICRPFQARGSLAGIFGSSPSLLEIPEAHSLPNANWSFSLLSKPL